MKERDKYIDAVKGIAVLNVIWTHTAFFPCFWTTPEWFKSLGLLFEMPLFFMLSGWAAGFNKRSVKKVFASIFKIFSQWIMFITLMAILCFISGFTPYPFEGISEIKDYIKNCFFIVSFPSLPVIEASVWFLQIYIIVIPVISLILIPIEKSSNVKRNKLIFLCIVFILYILSLFLKGFSDIPQRLLFYGIFYLLGQSIDVFCPDSAIKTALLSSVSAALYFIIMILTGGNPLSIQSVKFPPAIAFLFVSLVLIFPVLFLSKKIKYHSGVLSHIGENSLFYFFGQGVIVSLTARRGNLFIGTGWFLNWLLLTVIGIIFTSLFSEILGLIYKAPGRIKNGISA